MPTTKFQKFIFALMTVLITVNLFVFYNLAIEKGGMSNQVFIEAIKIVPIEFIFAISLELFIAGPLSEKIAFSIINPMEDKPYVITTAMICATVCLMCPMMSLVSAVLFNGFTIEIIAQWLQNIVINFPFAFFTQIFFVQPIVRFLFRNIFRSQLNQGYNETNEVV